MEVTKQINKWIDKYGNARDALNVALGMILELNAWIIAQEKCPHCFGELVTTERKSEYLSADGVVGIAISSHFECCSCGREWNYIGYELDDE